MQTKFLKPFIFILVFVMIASLGYGGYQYFLVVEEFKETKNNFALTQIEFEKKIKQLESNLSDVEYENTTLEESLAYEQNRNNDFEKQIDSIQGSVNIIEKLNRTDEELLQKYSKVYFLNENYVPSNLVEIDSEYLYNKKQLLSVHANVQSYLYSLLEEAVLNDIPMEIISAYRSFGTQTSLKTSYKITYGSGANAFSADQGYSEHQLGTAIDFTTPDLGALFSSFDKTTAYEWMIENAHKYGFTLSYPKGNTYYQFEPWHWRFVGVDLATELHNNNQYFYDIDQREINLYLISIFD